MKINRSVCLVCTQHSTAINYAEKKRGKKKPIRDFGGTLSISKEEKKKHNSHAYRPSS